MLAERPTAAQRPGSRPPERRATITVVMERKLATVLFVDLVGSTQLVAGADPEVVAPPRGAYFDRVSHCIGSTAASSRSSPATP